MFNIKSLTDGEILLLMARRSGKSNAEIAQLLDIHPNHLSKLFKSEKLNAKIRSKALRAFDASDDVFDLAKDYAMLPPSTGMVSDRKAVYEKDDAGLAEIVKAHNQERARLLEIIEKLVAK